MKKAETGTNIRSFRMPITLLLVVSFLFDLVVAYNCWAYKPWTQIMASDSGGFEVISIWHWSDTIILSVIVLFQIALIYVGYRSWSSKPNINTE